MYFSNILYTCNLFNTFFLHFENLISLNLKENEQKKSVLARCIRNLIEYHIISILFQWKKIPIEAYGTTAPTFDVLIVFLIVVTPKNLNGNILAISFIIHLLFVSTRPHLNY